MRPSVSPILGRKPGGRLVIFIAFLFLANLRVHGKESEKHPESVPPAGLSIMGGGAMLNMLPISSPGIYEQFNVKNNLFGGLHWNFANQYSTTIYISWYRSVPTVKNYTGTETFFLEKLSLGVKVNRVLYTRGRFSYYVSAGVSLNPHCRFSGQHWTKIG